MTREEAIAYFSERSKHLHEWLEDNENDEILKYSEAIDMAIEALKALPSAEAVSMEEHCKELNDLAVAWKAKFAKAEKRTNEIYDETMAKVAKECKECKERLRNLPSAEAVQGWIPCSERLPSAEDCPMDCLVTRRSKYVGNYTDMAVAEANGTWTHEDWKAITIKGEATCISTRDADIIAWMPLPKPYKGGEG